MIQCSKSLRANVMICAPNQSKMKPRYVAQFTRIITIIMQASHLTAIDFPDVKSVLFIVVCFFFMRFATKQNANKSECLRGCQYFNIEFLVNARNKDKLIDLNQLVERCGSCKCKTLCVTKAMSSLSTV